MSKETRYKWRTDTKPGQMEWIHKSKLLIDPTYQRRPTEQHLLRIAARWCWPAIGALTVVRRENGELYVVDGQHRKMAADRRTDITSLPCLVFDSKDLSVDTGEQQREARVFLEANVGRKAVSAIAKYRTAVALGQPDALIAQKLVQEAGRTVEEGGSNASTIRCIARLLFWIREEPERLQRLWPCLIKAAEGQTFSEILLDGVLYLDGHNSAGPKLSAKWLARIEEVGQKNLISAAQKAAMTYARGGAKVWAAGMLDVLNFKMHDRNRLALRVE